MRSRRWNPAELSCPRRLIHRLEDSPASKLSASSRLHAPSSNEEPIDGIALAVVCQAGTLLEQPQRRLIQGNSLLLCQAVQDDAEFIIESPDRKRFSNSPIEALPLHRSPLLGQVKPVYSHVSRRQPLHTPPLHAQETGRSCAPGGAP